MSTRSTRIDLRTSLEVKTLLQKAAESMHQTVTEFLLEHGLRAAEQRLADRRIFALGAEDWDAFTRILDRPAKDKPRLRKLLRKPSVLGK